MDKLKQVLQNPYINIVIDPINLLQLEQPLAPKGPKSRGYSIG